jgi:hypothetical protein
MGFSIFNLDGQIRFAPFEVSFFFRIFLIICFLSLSRYKKLLGMPILIGFPFVVAVSFLAVGANQGT